MRAEWLEGNPNSLMGRPLWIVQQDRNVFELWGCLTLDTLEQIIEGASRGDYIGTVDLTRSFRLGRGSKIRLGPDQLSYLTVDCPSAIHEEACRLALNCSPQRFIPPPALASAKRGSPAPSKSRARFLAATASHNYDLRTLSRWTKASELSGIGAAVFAQLENETVQSLVVDATQLAAACDPVLGVANPQARSLEELKDSEELNVDLNFVDIDPGCIVARKFVARASFDVSKSLLKTEAAEEAHQSIVRYLAAGIERLNASAKQTRSIDLFASIRGRDFLFEVKSANVSNALSQFSTGAVQLHAYDLAYRDTFESRALRVLVLQDLGDNAREKSLLIRLAHSLGIHLLFCDTQKPWPSGLQGLQSMLETRA